MMAFPERAGWNLEAPMAVFAVVNESTKLLLMTSRILRTTIIVRRLALST